jgi:DnaJ domain
MTLIEIAVILFGLFAGYWVVSKLFFGPPRVKSAANSVSAPGTPPPWYDTLQIAPSASALEIRTAYKQLISKYHPDKVDSLGQELRDLAGKKSQEIGAAYQEGMRARGEEP